MCYVILIIYSFISQWFIHDKYNFPNKYNFPVQLREKGTRRMFIFMTPTRWRIKLNEELNN